MVTPRPGLGRRAFLALPLAGCAAVDPPAPPASAAPAGDAPLLRPWRAVAGGFMGPAVPPTGLPVRPTGIYAKLAAPRALALRDFDLLIADPPSGRLWRADAVAGSFSGIAGAPAGPDIALALGPDLSAWVFDPVDRQVLRFGREGRLLQTYRIGIALASPVGFALADGGQTLLVADGLGAQWSEQRGPGGIVQLVRPSATGAKVGAIDALVPAREGLYALDRLAGVVHQLRRDGSALATLGRGDLMQPRAIAADRFDRVFVLDPPERALVVLQAGRPARRLPFDTLGVRDPVALACDGATLALSDPSAGQVQLLQVARPEPA